MSAYADPKSWFECRDDIKSILAKHLKTRLTIQWLDILEPAGVWCSDVFTWPRLLKHDAFKALDMVQDVMCQRWFCPSHHAMPHTDRWRDLQEFEWSASRWAAY